MLRPGTILSVLLLAVACTAAPARNSQPMAEAGSSAAGSGSVTAGAGAPAAPVPAGAGAGGSAGDAVIGGRGGRGGAAAGNGAAGAAAGSGGSGGHAGGAGAAGSAAGSGGSAGAAGMGPVAGASGEDCAADTAPPQALMLSGNLGTHDPVVIQADGRFYLFQTGRGIPTKTSTDLKAWSAGPAAFASNPAWIAQRVSGATDLWAPDISFFGGVYHLYYSASTFGSNRSCIGHATRAKLSEGSWMDQGPVICSNDGSSDNWNAIDPNLIVDEQGAAFLSFGSFWSGIKMIPLDAAGKRQGNELISLAARSGNSTAIEAPYIVRRCGYYYLFVSWDSCCKGADSTYKIVVGRSNSVRGPYMARDGMPLQRGGGTLILQGAGSWKGPGHNAVIHTDDGWFNVYHAYAASDGRSMLRISELAWAQDGWPTSAGP